MASNRPPHQPHGPNDPPATSTFLPTVCLYDWWLIEAEEEVQGKRLGVAGFTSPKKDHVKRGVRVFKSAPIIKVYDFSTLETVDNVCVIVNGFMNKSLTAENGFSPEVCKHFVFGFPLNWERIVAEQQGRHSAALKTSADMNSHVPDQSSPSKKDQKSPCKHNKLKSDRQPCARTNKNCSTENAKDYPSYDLPKDDSDETWEEPSPAPPLAKPRRSSRHIGILEEGNAKGETIPAGVIPQLQDKSGPDKKDHMIPGEVSRAKCKNQPRDRTKGKTENAKDCPGSDFPKNDADETREEPSSAPPLAKPRRSRQIGHSEQGDAKGETTPTGAVPHLQGTVRTADSFKRSRSGRILMPRLAFWRNELPIYDVNRKVAGVQSPNVAESRDGGNVSRRRK